MTTTTAPGASVQVHLPHDGRVTVFDSASGIGLQVRNEEFTALVFLGPEQAGAVSRALLRASTRLTHPELGAALDAGDVQTAAEVFLADLEARS